MRLRASMTWPLFGIHAIAAFVNPFTSDVIAEPTQLKVNRRGNLPSVNVR